MANYPYLRPKPSARHNAAKHPACLDRIIPVSVAVLFGCVPLSHVLAIIASNSIHHSSSLNSVFKCAIFVIFSRRIIAITWHELHQSKIKLYYKALLTFIYVVSYAVFIMFQ